MATRCVINFIENGSVCAKIYRHYDGFPSSVLNDLQFFFRDLKEQTKDVRFNDASLLATRFVVWYANTINRGALLDFLGLCIHYDANDVDDYVDHVYSVECAHLKDGYPDVFVER